MRQLMMTVVCVVFFAANACAMTAPDRVGKSDVGVNVSGAISTDKDINSTVYVGGNTSYGICKWFAVGLSAGWQNHGVNDITDSGVTLFGPDFRAFPLFGELIFRVPIENQSFVPYGVVGLGTVFWDVDDTTATDGKTTVNVNTKVSDSFAVKLGGGIDWFINENWIVNFESAYVFDRASVTETVSNGSLSVSQTLNNTKLDYWTVGGGVKYLFS